MMAGERARPGMAHLARRGGAARQRVEGRRWEPGPVLSPPHPARRAHLIHPPPPRPPTPASRAHQGGASGAVRGAGVHQPRQGLGVCGAADWHVHVRRTHEEGRRGKGQGVGARGGMRRSGGRTRKARCATAALGAEPVAPPTHPTLQVHRHDPCAVRKHGARVWGRWWGQWLCALPPRPCRAHHVRASPPSAPPLTDQQVEGIYDARRPAVAGRPEQGAVRLPGASHGRQREEPLEAAPGCARRRALAPLPYVT